MSPTYDDWTVPNLYRLRRGQALTQQELADRAGVNLITINRLERGFSARPQTIRKIAEALGVEPADLMAEPE
jgi:transcriptional regulator with XRE-family HTH domain